MSGWSRLGRKISSIAESATKKSGDLVESARLNAEIKRLEMDIEDIQFELGRAYYEQNKEAVIGPYAQFIIKIKDCEHELRLNEEKLLIKKGMLSCPGCGAAVDDADEFCGKCGARMSAREETGDERVCRNCGEACRGGEAYCPACGFLLK